MKLDYRKLVFTGKHVADALIGTKVTVDGVEIQKCFLVDTEQGIVSTYDVMGDGKTRVFKQVPSDDAALRVRLNTYLVDGVVWAKYIGGKVEVFDKDGKLIVE